jgi:hypothetical protein
MVKNVDKLVDCYVKNCKKELKNLRKKFGDECNKKNYKLYNDYEKGRISQKEFIQKATKNNEKLLNSYENIKLCKCEINNCYKYVKTHLDTFAAKVNYKKKRANYTAEDYSKIFQLIFKSNIKNIKF